MRTTSSLLPILFGIALAQDSTYNGSTPWEYQQFKTVNFTPPEFAISKNGQPLAQGLLVFTPISGEESAALIMNDDGELIWSSPPGTYNQLEMQTFKSEPVLTYWTGTGSANPVAQGHGYGSVTILDTTYKQLYNICPQLDIVGPNFTRQACNCDIHESYVTDRGSIIVTAYNLTTADLTSVGGSADGYIYDSQFYEVDIETQEILFSWSATKSGIPISSSKLPFSGYGTAGEPYDWFHVNAVQQVGDGYLVNSRHTWTTFMLNSTGGIQWQFSGDTGGDFTLPPGGNFSWQHHARAHNVTPTGMVLSYFNNYNSAGIYNGTHPSEGLAFNMNFTSKSATILKNLVDPAQPLYVDSQGAFTFLENGNIFMGYGQLPYMKEYGPDGNGDVRMTIQFENPTAAQSYRAYRQEWNAVPYTDPDALAINGTIYMSWNGATNVSSWEISGGMTNDTSAFKVLGRVAKQGFETEFGVANLTAVKYAQVAAYSGEQMMRASSVFAVQ